MGDIHLTDYVTKLERQNQLLEKKLERAMGVLKEIDNYQGADCYDAPEIANFALKEITEMKSEVGDE